MNDSLKHKIFTYTDCLSEQTMFDYIDKKLNAKESHSVEKHLLDCELCADAMEGLELTKNRTRISEINQKIREIIATPKKETRLISFNYKFIASIAATILLLIGGVFFFNQFNKKDEIAEFKPMKEVAVPPLPPEQSSNEEKIEDSVNPNLQIPVKAQAVDETKEKVVSKGKSKETQPGTFAGNGETEADYEISASDEVAATGEAVVTESPAVKSAENKMSIASAPSRSDNNIPEGGLIQNSEKDKMEDNRDLDGAGAAPSMALKMEETTVSQTKSSKLELSKNNDDDLAYDKASKKSPKTVNLFRSEPLEKRRAEKENAKTTVSESIAYAPQSIDSKDENGVTLTSDDVQADQKQEALTLTDQMPEFIGGADSLQTFIKKNFKYPPNYKNGEIANKKIFVNFIVNFKGEIKEAKISKGINPELDNEALRVINTMPKWKPGTSNGKPVSIKMNLPIKLD